MSSSNDYVDDISKYIIKEVPDFPMYYATECGRVISRHRGRLKFINGKLDKDGYVQLILRKEKVSYYKRLHRIIAETFTPNDNPNCVVAHIDGNISNNCVTNLKYCTQKENIYDKFTHGTMPIGEDVHNSEINREIAFKIKTMLNLGFSTKFISKELRIAKSIADNIKYGKTWNHVEV